MGNTRKIETTLSDHHNRLQNKPDQLQDKYEHNQHTTCTNARGLAEQHAEMLGGQLFLPLWHGDERTTES